MGTSAGPNLAGIGRGGASNLVLEMDAHDAKSYPGEPTTNLQENGVYTGFENNSTSGWSWDAKTNGAFSVISSDSHSGKYCAKLTNSTVDSIALWKDITITSGVTYTWTVWVKNISCPTTPNFSSAGVSVSTVSGGSNFTGISDEWQRFHWTFTASSTGTFSPYIRTGSNAAQGYFLVDDIQIEQKAYATPYVQEIHRQGLSTGTYAARPASVNLMIHGNVGTGQSFSDSSPSKHTVTANGNTTHSSAESKFSGGSVYFDGTGDYLNVSDSTDWEFSNGIFTIDFWYKNNSTATSRGVISITNSSAASNYESILVFTAGSGTNLVFYSSSNNTWDIASGAAMGAFGSGWTHYAIVRESVAGDIKLYNNGALQTTVSTSATLRAVDAFRIGQRVSAASGASCYLDEIRVTKGTALWTSAFTPPTRRNLSAPVVDRSGNHNGINLINGTDSGGETYRVGEVIRPIDTAVWDFDGTDDYAIAGDSDDWNFGSEPFAIEQWLRFTDLTPSGDVWVTTLQQYAAEGDRNGWLLFYNNGGDFEWRLECTAPSPSFTPTHIVTGCSLNTWYLFTISREGSSFKMYIDGDLRLTDTSNPTFTNIAGPMYVGNYAAGDPHEFQGQMGALRIYKGGALTDQQVVENFNQQRSRFNI